MGNQSCEIASQLPAAKVPNVATARDLLFASLVIRVVKLPPKLTGVTKYQVGQYSPKGSREGKPNNL